MSIWRASSSASRYSAKSAGRRPPRRLGSPQPLKICLAKWDFSNDRTEGDPPQRLKGKTAVVTGAGRGIGQASALCSLPKGRISLMERDDAPLVETAEEMKARRACFPLRVVHGMREGGRGRLHGGPARCRCDRYPRQQSGRERSRTRQRVLRSSSLRSGILSSTSRSSRPFSCSRQVRTDMRQRGTGKIVNISSHVAFTAEVLPRRLRQPRWAYWDSAIARTRAGAPWRQRQCHLSGRVISPRLRSRS
jgi:hypothetical protein